MMCVSRVGKELLKSRKLLVTDLRAAGRWGILLEQGSFLDEPSKATIVASCSTNSLPHTCSKSKCRLAGQDERL